MNPVNWTAILTLLAACGILGFLAWYGMKVGREYREVAVEAWDKTETYRAAQHAAEIESRRLAGELATEQRLHRNLLARQSRSASRKVQHQERGNAAD